MASRNRPRVLVAQRDQVEWKTFHLDGLIPSDHRARVIWQVLERLDLSAFYGEILSRDERAGRPATDPKILLALWLYATTDGVGSGRELERLCVDSNAYRWLCGGVSVNYHTLNDFRVGHGEKLDQLMVQILGAMTLEGLVTLERVAQDGMRVRADAGAASFRKEATLIEHQKAARAHIDELKRKLNEDPGAKIRAEEAARLRAAETRLAKIDRALAEMPKVIAVKRRNRAKSPGKKQSPARVSTTDPESRVMKMGDGGFRPALNVQLANDCKARVIVGVTLTNAGTDVAEMIPMLDDIKRRTGRTPGDYLVDGGFINLAAIDTADSRGVTVYAPPRKPGVPRGSTTPRKHPDTPATAQWRRRMERADSAQIYKQRAATAETTNADLRRWRTLDRFAVRGIAKARCQVLLNVLAFNIQRWDALEAA
jgi:transposase